MHYSYHQEIFSRFDHDTFEHILHQEQFGNVISNNVSYPVRFLTTSTSRTKLCTLILILEGSTSRYDCRHHHFRSFVRYSLLSELPSFEELLKDLVSLLNASMVSRSHPQAIALDHLVHDNKNDEPHENQTQLHRIDDLSQRDTVLKTR